MKLILFLLRSAPGMVAFAILAGIIAGVSNTGLLALINAALNRADSGQGSPVWAFVGLCALMLIGRGASSMLLIRLARGAVYDLRIKLCRKVLAAPLRHLEQIGAARIQAALTDDVPVIANALISLPVICMHFAVVVTCLIYLGWLSWPVLLGVLGFLLIGILTYYIPLTRATHYLNISRHHWDALFKHFRAMTDGAKELKLHQQRRNSFITEQLETTAEAVRRSGTLGDTIYAVAASWGQLLVFILIGALVFVLPSVQPVSMKTLTGYSLVVLYMMVPFEVILNTLPAFSRANIAMQKVRDLGLSLETQSVENLERVGEVSADDFTGLDLSGVRHAYHTDGRESSFMLGPLDLSFRPGELVFLVGGNGSGKTTLAKIITGLYVPEGGEVRLNGKLIDDENREQYRQTFSVVFSDFYLFESLLGMHLPKLDEEARRYLIQLQLDHKVEVKDGVLSTTELSQGQRKRLALMTAYLEDRPVYVFDEWAADQDPVFKEIFYLQLLPELKARGKAVLVISHDDRYFHVADRIVKLDSGRVEYYKQLGQPAYALAGAE